MASPCVAELGGQLSAVRDAVWARCATGTMARLSISTDSGASWHDVIVSGGLPNSAVVGARTADQAVVADPERTLTLVAAGGVETAAVVPSHAIVAYVGFTTSSVGVAVTVNPQQLWRTTDSGRTWTVVHFTQ